MFYISTFNTDYCLVHPQTRQRAGVLVLDEFGIYVCMGAWSGPECTGTHSMRLLLSTLRLEVLTVVAGSRGECHGVDGDFTEGL